MDLGHACSARVRRHGEARVIEADQPSPVRAYPQPRPGSYTQQQFYSTLPRARETTRPCVCVCVVCAYVCLCVLMCVCVVWCGVVWCGAAQRGVVRCGVAWHGVVWRGVAWCVVVWCGVVCACVSVFLLEVFFFVFRRATDGKKVGLIVMVSSE